MKLTRCSTVDLGAEAEVGGKDLPENGREQTHQFREKREKKRKGEEKRNSHRPEAREENSQESKASPAHPSGSEEDTEKEDEEGDSEIDGPDDVPVGGRKTKKSERRHATCLKRREARLTKRPAREGSRNEVSIQEITRDNEEMNETHLLGTIDVRSSVAEEVRQTVSREHHSARAGRRCEDLGIYGTQREADKYALSALMSKEREERKKDATHADLPTPRTFQLHSSLSPPSSTPSTLQGRRTFSKPFRTPPSSPR